MAIGKDVANFHLFSLKCCVSVYISKKSKKLWKILKTISGSIKVFALSNNITCSQTQTGATVPLKR
jgi:hypothetical protein